MTAESWWWGLATHLDPALRPLTIQIGAGVDVTPADVDRYKDLAGASLLGGPNIIVLEFDGATTEALRDLLRGAGFMPGVPRAAPFRLEARP